MTHELFSKNKQFTVEIEFLEILTQILHVANNASVKFRSKFTKLSLKRKLLTLTKNFMCHCNTHSETLLVWTYFESNISL